MDGVSLMALTAYTLQKSMLPDKLKEVEPFFRADSFGNIVLTWDGTRGEIVSIRYDGSDILTYIFSDEYGHVKYGSYPVDQYAGSTLCVLLQSVTLTNNNNEEN